VKQKLSYLIVGLFIGLITGFVVTNHLNRQPLPVGKNASGTPGSMPAVSGQMPEGHPEIPSEKEIREAMAAVDAAPDDFQKQFGLAGALMQMGRAKDAIRYYERAQQLKPNDAEVLAGLGNAWFDSASAPGPDGEPHYDNASLARAAEYYSKSLAINPDNPNVRTDLGLTYFFRQPPDAERAIAEYRKSLAVAPNHQITMQNLIVALRHKGDLDGAEEVYARLQQVAPSNPQLARLRSDLDRARSGEEIPSH
jgi:tetratricopeptide (TPR) repeat protein